LGFYLKCVGYRTFFLGGGGSRRRPFQYVILVFVLYENLYQNIVACQDEEGEESVFRSGFPPLMAADGWDAQQQSVAFNPFDPMDQSAQHLAEEWGFHRDQNAEELLKQASRKKGSWSQCCRSGSGTFPAW
jgi:hypothetical protein